MDITWNGETCFTIKGKHCTIVTDPYKNPDAKAPNLKADMVLLSHGAKDLLPVNGEPKTFDWPGEYEVKEASVVGLQAWDMAKSKETEKEKGSIVTIFKVTIDGIRVCFLGNIGHKLTTEMVESLGDIDILLIPIGGDKSLDVKKAHEVIEQIEPRAVIPMLYDDIDPFLKEMGVKPVEIEKFSISSLANLPEDRIEVFVLRPMGA